MPGFQVKFLWFPLTVFLASTDAAYAAHCNVDSSGLSFGVYNPTLKNSVESNARLEVACTGVPGERVNFSLMLMRSPTASRAHILAGNKQSMEYQLFTDPGRKQIWGDGSSGTSVIRDSIILRTANSVQDYFVYALLAPDTKPVVAGQYTENLVVTLEQ